LRLTVDLDVDALVEEAQTTERACCGGWVPTASTSAPSERGWAWTAAMADPARPDRRGQVTSGGDRWFGA
jgi:hypothetical protein